jgi:CubicO group peptidase (beta-lactamase class C family)
VASGAPMPRAAPQPVGSATKVLVAIAVLRQVERGRIGLDETLAHAARRHRKDGGALAALAAQYAVRLRGVTIRQLLNMTSGLRSYDDTEAFGRAFAAAPHAPRSLAELAAYGLAEPIAFRPNQRDRTLYSNTNYALLGMLLEAVTGRPLAAVLATDVFVPAGMRHTSYPTGDGDPPEPVHGYQPTYPAGTALPALLEPFAALPPVARTFAPRRTLAVSNAPTAQGPTTPVVPASARLRARIPAPDPYTWQDVGEAYSLLGAGGAAGAARSTTDDLARCFRRLFDGRLLGRRARRALETVVPAPPNAPGVRYFYGPGVMRTDVDRGALYPGAPRMRIWLKLGDVFGYTSATYAIQHGPFNGVVVSTTTNLFPAPVGDLGVLRDTLRALGP